MLELLVAAVVSTSPPLAPTPYPEALPEDVSDYQLAPVSRVDVTSGPPRISIENTAPSPRGGTFPARVFIDNRFGLAQPVTVEIRSVVSGGAHRVQRTVDLAAGERRVLEVPLPAEMRYGAVTASGPLLRAEEPAQVWFSPTYGVQKVVLALGTPDEFERYIDKPSNHNGGTTHVQAVPPAEAPSELASYVGFDAVVVPGAEGFDELTAAQRSALERYVATGGVLVLARLPTHLDAFPLAPVVAGHTAYGFGSVLVNPVLPLAEPWVRDTLPLSPRDHRSNRYSNERVAPLLSQAQAPLGRFLIIIALFTTAIGPGSIWVSRRKGPAALLVTIPATALVTCAVILGYSLAADGFTVHSSSYSFTWLDGSQRRAITHAVTGYYANLAPRRFRFDLGTVPIASWADSFEHHVADFSWGDGLSLGADFVPSRSYREWGFLSVEPSRARVMVERKGQTVLIRNALGFSLDAVEVQLDGQRYTATGLSEGAEVVAEPGPALTFSGHRALDRFLGPAVELVARAPLADGEFRARSVGGDGFVPTGGVSTERSDGEHWVRGRFE